MENEHTMTLAEVAALFGVTSETVRKWRRDRGFPFVQLNPRSLRFSRREVLEWQNRQRPGMQVPPPAPVAPAASTSTTSTMAGVAE